MFSVIFPGQGSQTVGMAKDLYNKFSTVKDLFSIADDTLKFPITKLILEGPSEKLNETENTQPAIFLVGFSIFRLIKKDFGINLNNAVYFAGHSLGEYTALACAEVLGFSETLNLLKKRGKSMQQAVPNGEGGMVAILGSTTNEIEKILNENAKSYECYIANDNSNGQLVVSGRSADIDLLIADLKKNNIKSIKLPVSAPFHCKLMNKATFVMSNKINDTKFEKPKNPIISNVTGNETQEIEKIKELLVKQIESPVLWRESVIYMIKNGVSNFIEIGPGKVLSGLVKRIDKTVNVHSINKLDDLNNIKSND